jgi:hypothetical protein
MQENLKMCPLGAVAIYTQVNYNIIYALLINGKIRVPFIDTDLLYRGNLSYYYSSYPNKRNFNIPAVK